MYVYVLVCVCCPFVFEFSVGIGGFVIGLGQISFFFSVYVLEHIVSLYYRIPRWIFTKLGRDKILMTPHISVDFWAKSAQGWIQVGAEISHGGPLLQRTSTSDGKATATKRMHSNYIEAFGKKCCYILVKSSIWMFLSLHTTLTQGDRNAYL